MGLRFFGHALPSVMFNTLALRPANGTAGIVGGDVFVRTDAPGGY